MGTQNPGENSLTTWTRPISDVYFQVNEHSDEHLCDYGQQTWYYFPFEKQLVRFSTNSQTREAGELCLAHLNSYFFDTRGYVSNYQRTEDDAPRGLIQLLVS